MATKQVRDLNRGVLACGGRDSRNTMLWAGVASRCGPCWRGAGRGGSAARFDMMCVALLRAVTRGFASTPGD